MVIRADFAGTTTGTPAAGKGQNSAGSRSQDGATFCAIIEIAVGATSIEMAGLVTAVRRLYVEARAAAPRVQLDEERFVERVVQAIDGEPDPMAALEAIHAGDLFVAQAAAAGDDAAFVLVDRRMCDQIAAVVRSLGESRGFADDLESAMRAHILMPRDGAAPRLASYAGAGPLDGWLRVTATREAVRARRAQAARGSASEDELANLPGVVAPELDFLKASYREQVRTAFRAAIHALDDRQQNLIRLHYGDGVGVERLGLMYRVHFSTISRWIAAARDRLFDQTRAAIRAQLGVDNGEFEEIMDLVRSRLDLTISLFVRGDS
jgi:RNA polymerase sigma-70 factor (ECF subfamily)